MLASGFGILINGRNANVGVLANVGLLMLILVGADANKGCSAIAFLIEVRAHVGVPANVDLFGHLSRWHGRQ